jgi:hypothetical protein
MRTLVFISFFTGKAVVLPSIPVNTDVNPFKATSNDQILEHREADQKSKQEVTFILIHFERQKPKLNI